MRPSRFTGTGSCARLRRSTAPSSTSTHPTSTACTIWVFCARKRPVRCGRLAGAGPPDPRSVEVHNNLANVLALLKRHDEAVAGFRIAIALKPDFAEAHNNLGNALAGAGRRR